MHLQICSLLVSPAALGYGARAAAALGYGARADSTQKYIKGSLQTKHALANMRSIY